MNTKANSHLTTPTRLTGAAILPAYDALRKFPIRHVLVRHEQGAAHMADGYARATGKVGVAIATSGPGATNLVTGIATAMLDSVPIVCITGNVSSKVLGTDAFQEVDITGITLPITKHNFLVNKADDLAAALRQAFQIARAGRPGRAGCCWIFQRTPDRLRPFLIPRGPSPSRTVRIPCCASKNRDSHRLR